jgi:hypothetical protein
MGDKPWITRTIPASKDTSRDYDVVSRYVIRSHAVFWLHGVAAPEFDAARWPLDHGGAAHSPVDDSSAHHASTQAAS